MAFSGAVTTDQYEAGCIEGVQTELAYMAYGIGSGWNTQIFVRSTGAAVMLDDYNGKVAQEYYNPIAASATSTIIELAEWLKKGDPDPPEFKPWVDSPWISLELSPRQSFASMGLLLHSYIMYRPDGDKSIFVTQANCLWGCIGTTSSLGGGKWSVPTGAAFVSAVVPGGLLPEWTNYWGNTDFEQLY